MKRNVLFVVALVVVAALYGLYGCSQPASTATTTTTTSSTTTTSTTLGTSTTTSSATTTSIATHPLVGTWVGTWEDSFDLAGSLRAVITQTGTMLSGTGSIGLSALSSEGYAFSTESGVATGVISSGSNSTFAFSSPSVGGSGSGTITGNTVVGTGEFGAFGIGSPFIFIGTIEADGNAVNAFFDFTYPGAGDGTARVIKQ